MRLTWISLTAVTAAILVAALAETVRGPDPAAAGARLLAAGSAQFSMLRVMAPVHGLWTLCGVLAGLALRDRVPMSGSHSSPTAAWLAKRAIALGAVTAASFGVGALKVDPGWMHGAAALHAVGWLVYLRNLPARL